MRGKKVFVGAFFFNQKNTPTYAENMKKIVGVI
jgi:hypothetical protein